MMKETMTGGHGRDSPAEPGSSSPELHSPLSFCFSTIVHTGPRNQLRISSKVYPTLGNVSARE